MDTENPTSQPLVAIACGGTGGHLFPGLAVARTLTERGCAVSLLVSPKEVDQQALGDPAGLAVEVLPAVGLTGFGYFAFLRGFWRSYRQVCRLFHRHPPAAVLAMGGFTSAPPVHAGKKFGAATFLHDSNTIPGRANRWLARFVHQAFVGFPSAGARLRHPRVLHVGTPVRPEFASGDPGAFRQRLGLRSDREVLLIMGGSQGASGINDVCLRMLPQWKTRLARWQFLHLTGARDLERVRFAYHQHGLTAAVHPFLRDMPAALGAASFAISRAGGSSLAELAAMRCPVILIPYPAAADNHQYFNARAFADAGAAFLLEQREATPERLGALVLELADQPDTRARMADAIHRWHQPTAAAQMTEAMLTLMSNLHGLKFPELPVSADKTDEKRLMFA